MQIDVYSHLLRFQIWPYVYWSLYIPVPTLKTCQSRTTHRYAFYCTSMSQLAMLSDTCHTRVKNNVVHWNVHIIFCCWDICRNQRFFRYMRSSKPYTFLFNAHIYLYFLACRWFEKVICYHSKSVRIVYAYLNTFKHLLHFLKKIMWNDLMTYKN